MKFVPHDPPRSFEVGFEHRVTLQDCGDVELEPDEQVTFRTPGGAEYDVTRKAWGFYATPSTNGRLSGFGLRAVLTRNRDGRAYVLLVESGQEEAFERYAAGEPLEVLAWLDRDEAVEALAQRLC